MPVISNCYNRISNGFTSAAITGGGFQQMEYILPGVRVLQNKFIEALMQNMFK
jgi:hypothetical protein